jgi:hypothetical protein
MGRSSDGACAGDIVVEFLTEAIVDKSQLMKLADAGNAKDRDITLVRAGVKLQFNVERGKLGIALKARKKIQSS